MFGRKKSLLKKTKKVNKGLLDLCVKTGTSMIRCDDEDGWKTALENIVPSYVDVLKQTLELQNLYAEKIDLIEQEVAQTNRMVQKLAAGKE